MQPTGSIEDWFRALSLKDSGILYEDPYIQVGLTVFAI
jgi:AP-2 complex subunit alpha